MINRLPGRTPGLIAAGLRKVLSQLRPAKTPAEDESYLFAAARTPLW